MCDALTQVVMSGYSPDFALDLPLSLFSELVESVVRVRSARQTENLYLHAHAAQADGEAIAKFAEGLTQRTDRATSKTRPKKVPRSF